MFVFKLYLLFDDGLPSESAVANQKEYLSGSDTQDNAKVCKKIQKNNK